MTSAPVKGAARRLGPLRAGAVGICLLVAATGAVRAFAAPAAASAAASAAAAVESVYFELEIDGRRAGYAEEHERRAASSPGLRYQKWPFYGDPNAHMLRPTLLTSMKGEVAAVACGASHTALLTRGGLLYTWGP